MNFSNPNLFKDPLDELDTDFSDISDVKPSDLDKILKSAKDLDDEILGGGKDKVKDDKKKNKEDTDFFDKSLSDLGSTTPRKQDLTFLKSPSSEEKKKKKDAIASLFGLSDDVKLDTPPKSSPSRIGFTEESKPKPRNSSDWLGLTGTPEKQVLSTVVAKPMSTSASSVKLNVTSTALDDVPKRPKTDDIFAVKPAVTVDPLVSNFEPKVEKRRTASNLLDDLFGNDRIKHEEAKVDRSFPFSAPKDRLNLFDPKPATENTGQAYTPSLSTELRLERRRDSGSKLIISSRTESVQDSILPDWMGPSDRTATRRSEVNRKVSEPKLSKDIPSLRIAERFSVHDQNTVEESRAEITRKTTKEKVESLEIVENSKETQTAEETVFSFETQGGVDVVGQLARVKAQLSAAMTRHNETLHTYMQALMKEAERVAIGNKFISSLENKLDLQTAKHDSNNQSETEEDISQHSEIQQKCNKQRKDQIFNLQVSITELELKNTQLEMKIKTNEEIKDMEVDKIRKLYAFEISNWEIKFERMKTTFEEIIADYEAKICRFKSKEEEEQKELKKRLEAIETERWNDMEKLGEFQRMVIEHNSMIGLSSTSGFSARIKFPLKLSSKPVDEEELTEREAALIEKERDIEVLKATVESQKLELDEAIEREKIARQERERDVKRSLMELKLKEEYNSKEHERKMQHLTQQEKLLKEMREQALKEQQEITKEKLTLAADKARLEATISIQTDPNSANLNPLDIMKARAEVDAAIEAARTARELADQERRRHVELRKTVEEISWEQKDKDEQLEMRERHISLMMKDAENRKTEGLKALEEVKHIEEEIEQKHLECHETLKQLETREKTLAKERLEIAKERLELEKHKSQLELLLPELSPAEDITFSSAQKMPTYRDPKAVIMRLKAEKDLQDYIAPIRQKRK